MKKKVLFFFKLVPTNRTLAGKIFISNIISTEGKKRKNPSSFLYWSAKKKYKSAALSCSIYTKAVTERGGGESVWLAMYRVPISSPVRRAHANTRGSAWQDNSPCKLTHAALGMKKGHKCKAYSTAWHLLPFQNFRTTRKLINIIMASSFICKFDCF